MMHVHLEIVYGDKDLDYQHRRFSVPNNISFQSFRDLLCIFNDHDDFSVSYEMEKDIVYVDTEDEFEEAKRLFGNDTLHIITNVNDTEECLTDEQRSELHEFFNNLKVSAPVPSPGFKNEIRTSPTSDDEWCTIHKQ
jgi:hypothetical protein